MQKDEVYAGGEPRNWIGKFLLRWGWHLGMNWNKLQRQTNPNSYILCLSDLVTALLVSFLSIHHQLFEQWWHWRSEVHNRLRARLNEPGLMTVSGVASTFFFYWNCNWVEINSTTLSYISQQLYSSMLYDKHDYFCMRFSADELPYGRWCFVCWFNLIQECLLQWAAQTLQGYKAFRLTSPKMRWMASMDQRLADMSETLHSRNQVHIILFWPTTARYDLRWIQNSTHFAIALIEISAELHCDSIHHAMTPCCKR